MHEFDARAALAPIDPAAGGGIEDDHVGGGAGCEAGLQAQGGGGEGQSGGGSETISSDEGGDNASDEEDEPARPTGLPLDELRDEAEVAEAERLRQELEVSRRLSAELDGLDDDLSLPREPDGLLEPGEGSSLDDEFAVGDDQDD